MKPSTSCANSILFFYILGTALKLVLKTDLVKDIFFSEVKILKVKFIPNGSEELLRAKE